MGNCCPCLRKKKNIITSSSDQKGYGIQVKSISSPNSNHVQNLDDQDELPKKLQQINVSPLQNVRNLEHSYDINRAQQTLELPPSQKHYQSAEESTHDQQPHHLLKLSPQRINLSPSQNIRNLENQYNIDRPYQTLKIPPSEKSPNRQDVQINKIMQKSDDCDQLSLIAFSDCNSNRQNEQTTRSHQQAPLKFQQSDSVLDISDARQAKLDNSIMQQLEGDQDSDLQLCQQILDIPLLLGGGQFDIRARQLLCCQYCLEQEGDMIQLKCGDLYHSHCVTQLLEKLDDDKYELKCRQCKSAITSDILKNTAKSFKHRIMQNNQLKQILQQNQKLIQCQQKYCSFFWKQDQYSKDESFCPYHHF